jgi:hypothetical protein
LQEEEFWRRFGANLDAIQQRHKLNLEVGSSPAVLADITSRANNGSHEIPGKV